MAIFPFYSIILKCDAREVIATTITQKNIYSESSSVREVFRVCSLVLGDESGNIARLGRE